MRKYLLKIIIFLFVLNQMPVAYAAENAVFAEFYISATGNDLNDGSKGAPFATIKRAQEAVREKTENMNGDIIVNIESGEYFLEDTLDFEPQDSGKNGYQVIYRGNKDNMPLISGGKKVSGFTQNESNPNIWQAEVDGIEQLRALYVNNTKYHTARNSNLVMGVGGYDYDDPNTEEKFDGIYMSKSDLGFYENPEDIEFVWFVNWNVTLAHVTDIVQDPENSDRVIAMMTPGLWNALQLSNTLKTTDGQSQKLFWIQNAYELLDTPGEFYYNKKTKILSLIPHADVNMEDAEIIAPKLEKIMRIYGNDIDEKVENITFEGIKFGHSENYSLSYGDLKTSQTTCVNYDSNWLTAAYQGTIVLDRTNNVNFKNNYFFGFSNPGLMLKNGVSESKVEGNAFSDMGHASVVVGDVYRHVDGFSPTGSTVKNGVSARPENPKSQFNLINARMGTRTPGTSSCAASYWGNKDYSIRNISGGELYYDEDKYKARQNTSWFSDPKGPEKGEKAWVKYDFDKPATISEVILRFDTEKITPPQRTGYEILLSNDRNFENYVTVATQTSAANAVERYPATDTNKYKFLMVRTLSNTQLGITSVLALTPDIKNNIVWAEKCRNIDITNNYIERTATEIMGGCGIIGFYTKDVKVHHNEIVDTGYTAISWGYGWGWGAEGEENNNISYNFAYNTSRFSDDGGGFYTLSPQKGTVISNNYLDKVWQSRGTYYTDQGSSYITLFNNVGTNLQKMFYMWASDSVHNKVYNNYSTTSQSSGNGNPTNLMEPLNVFVQGNPPPQAYEIMQNAGLEKGYEYLRTWVHKGDYDLPVEIDRFRVMHINEYGIKTRLFDVNDDIAKGILNSKKFGNIPGAFPYEYKYALKDASEFYAHNFDYSPSVMGGTIMHNSVNSDEYMMFFNYREIVEAGDKVIQRYDYEDMVSYCENLLQNAYGVNEGETVKTQKQTYPKTALEEFETALNAVKQKSSYAVGISEKYALVLEMEEALFKLEQTRMNADIEYMYVKGALKTQVNKETKEVLVYLNKGEKSKERKVEIIIPGGAEFGGEYSKMSFEADRQVAVYSPASKEYTMWTVKAKEIKHTESDIISPDNWVTDNPENEKGNGILKMADGSVILSNNYHPYLSTEYSDTKGGASVKFNPGKEYENRTFTFIMGAKTANSFKIYDKSSDSDRLELEYSSGKVTLYSIKSGVKTAISQTDVQLNKGEENTLEYSILPQGESSVIKIKLNGVMIFNTTSNSLYYSKFFGYYSEKVNMQILKYN